MTASACVRRIVTAVVLVTGLILSFAYFPALVALFARYAIDYPVFAALLYVTVTATAIVVLPLSSMPLLPVAAAAWGVILGGVLSIIGWWIGAIIAFLMARFLGRPVLERLVSPEKLNAWEGAIPADTGFFAIVVIRMIFPVEIPSFVLGLTKAVSFRVYTIASLIGMTPFAFAVLSMGTAIAEADWIRLSLTGVALALAVFTIRRVYERYRDRT